MESARNFLLILLVFLSFLLYTQWQEANAPEPTKRAPIESSLESTSSDASFPEEGTILTEERPDLSSELPMDNSAKPVASKPTSTKPILVETDTLRVVISPNGGNLVSAELLNFKEALSPESAPINILENRNGRVFIASAGLYGQGAPDFDKNVAYYSVEQNENRLRNDQDTISVDLNWVNAQGIEYTKRFTFYRGKYSIDVEFLVNNTGAEKIANRMFTALKRDILPVDGQESSTLGMQSYVGPAISTMEEKYEKFPFEDIEEEPINTKTKNGWVAILQHYFVTAWVPVSENINIIDTTTKGLGKNGLAQVRITQDWEYIQPGQTKSFKAKLYVGPKIQSELEKVADGLDLTVDYGFLWWIGQPIFALLLFLQGFVINWGAAIILVTIVLKTLLYPLARTQYRSFAKMRLLQPQLTAMKERYGDDRQAMSMKMMELYKKEKVNPLGGCFPLLLQMPIFIALYWVLMESVELRHAPFVLWIEDMSVKDPYYILPLLMGASMYLMQKMQPTAPNMDPMQAKMLQMMPVFMTIFFVWFPAGLVLYWLANNLISIAQQLYITNQFNKEQEAKKSKKSGKKK